MSYKYCYLKRVGLLAVAVTCASLVGCNDKGVEPKPTVPVDYLVYFVDTEKPVIFSYNPANGALDSIVAPFLVKGLKVTPDGEVLYISDTDSTILYDIATGQTISSQPRTGIALSRDGKLYAKINANLNEPIQVLRRSDDSVLFADTSFVFAVQFSRDNKRIYGATSENPGGTRMVYTANLMGDQTIKRKQFAGNVQGIIPSPDESKWFIYSWGNVNWLFMVYDVAGDSLIFSKDVIPGWGGMTMTPDGSHIFYTAPGDFPSLGGPPPPNTIMAFDVEANGIVAEIPTSFLSVSDTFSIVTDFPVGQIAITADGKWLVGLGSAPLGGVVITIDVSTLTAKETVVLGTGRQLSRLTTAME